MNIEHGAYTYRTPVETFHAAPACDVVRANRSTPAPERDDVILIHESGPATHGIGNAHT